MMSRFFLLQCCIAANRMTLQHFTIYNRLQERKTRNQSKQIRKSFKTRTLHVGGGSQIQDSPKDSPNTTVDELTEKSETTENQFSEAPSEENDEKSILYNPLIDSQAENSPQNPQKSSRSTTLNKKYSNILNNKHINADASEQVLLEVNTTLRRLDKGDKRRKFLVLNNYICLIDTAIVKASNTIIRSDKIVSLLENENQFMLMIVGEVNGKKQEFCCIFDNRLDYSKVASTTKNMAKHLSNKNEQVQSTVAELDLTEYDWQELLSTSTKKVFQSGEFLIHRGTPSSALYKIAKGSFEVRKIRETEAFNSFVDAGCYLGELTFIQGGVASASVVALEDACEVICFERNGIDNLALTNPALVGKFYRMVSLKMIERFLQIQKSIL